MLRIIKFYWPVFIVLFLNLGLTAYLETIPNTECHFIFGQSTALLALYQFSYALPGLIFICSIYAFIFGIYGLKQSKYPPDGFPIFARKKSYGLSAKLINVTGLLLPFFAVFLIYLGIQSIDSIAEGKTHKEINQVFFQQCSSS